MTKPTTAQIRRAAHLLYDGHTYDPQIIMIHDNTKELRHEDDVPGTWIDASIWVPDHIALGQKP